MKRLIIFLTLIFSVSLNFCVEQQQFSDQQKAEKTTGSFIKLLDSLVAKNVITASHLQRLHDAQELINPMTAEDRAVSSTNLVYAKGLDSFIAQGKQFIDNARVKEWLIAKIAELQHDETTRKEVHEDTREIHRPMRFVPIPAGKYVDQITHEEFEILPGIEIQETPVTQWQLVQIMGANPSVFVNGLDSETHNNVKMLPDAPVENVCWNDVQEFIKKLNEDKDYAYALPSVVEYQVVTNTFKQNGSFVEYQGKRVWHIVGAVWQWTRDTVEYQSERVWDIVGKIWQWASQTAECKDKKAHLVFGGAQEIKGAKDTVRPVVYDQSKSQSISLRLIRYKKQSLCEQKATNYSSKQLSWDQSDCSVDSKWQWDKTTQKILFEDDGLQWIDSHRSIYPVKMIDTLDRLRLNDQRNWPMCSSDDIRCLQSITSVNFFKPDEIRKSEDLTILTYLIHLTDLDLRVNNVQDISSLCFLQNLKSLNLGFNKVKDLEPLNNLKKLTELYLQVNKIENLRALKSLTNLETLILPHNQIKDIASLSSLPNLHRLDLSHNPINDLTPLQQLKSLSTLDLDKDQIERLHAREVLPGVDIMEAY